MRRALRREFRRIAGHAVIEARADRDQEIAVIDGVVGKRRAMHAQHAHRQRIGRIDGTDAHQRGDHRNAEVPARTRPARSAAPALMTPPPA